ncbi:MAG TPA: hypothetical protein VIG72_06285 [Pontibacter sp.]
MKLIIFLLAVLFFFVLAFKKAADDMRQLSMQQELKQSEAYPNLLPVVEVVTTRS